MDEPVKDLRNVESSPKSQNGVKTAIGAYVVVKITEKKYVLCQVVSQHVSEKDAEVEAGRRATDKPGCHAKGRPVGGYSTEE